MVTLSVPKYLSAGNNNRFFIQNCLTLLGGKASWWRGAVADAAWGEEQQNEQVIIQSHIKWF